jgi:hypothetical protein
VPVTASPPPPSDYEPYFPYPDTQLSEESMEDHDFTGIQHEKSSNRQRATADPASIAENGEAGNMDALSPPPAIAPALGVVGEVSEFEEDFRYHRKGSMSIGSGSTAVGATTSRTSHMTPGKSKASHQTQPTGVHSAGGTPPAPSRRQSHPPPPPPPPPSQAPPSHAPRRNSDKNESAVSAYKPRRLPPTTPVLLPEWRYCKTCEIVKPYRTHHCRACGTCVLRYDHHCPCMCHLLDTVSLCGLLMEFVFFWHHRDRAMRRCSEPQGMSLFHFITLFCYDELNPCRPIQN